MSTNGSELQTLMQEWEHKAQAAEREIEQQQLLAHHFRRCASELESAIRREAKKGADAIAAVMGKA